DIKLGTGRFTQELTMTKKMTWILVTDGGHAKIFVQDDKSKPLQLLHDLTHTHNLTSEMGSDRPGRVSESATIAHHAYAPKTDWHEHQKELFAQELIQLFIKEHQKKKFMDVYLICPPKIMGFLRSDISDYANKLPLTE